MIGHGQTIYPDCSSITATIMKLKGVPLDPAQLLLEDSRSYSFSLETSKNTRAYRRPHCLSLGVYKQVVRMPRTRQQELVSSARKRDSFLLHASRCSNDREQPIGRPESIRRRASGSSLSSVKRATAFHESFDISKLLRLVLSWYSFALKVS